MLTVEKVRTYEQFDGDIDGWVRAFQGKGKSCMTDADLYLINELLMGLAAVAAGLASPSFSRQVENKVLASTADEATRVALRALVARPSCNRILD